MYDTAFYLVGDRHEPEEAPVGRCGALAISFADCRDQAVSFRLPTTNAPNPIAKKSSVDVVSARVEQPSMCQPSVL